MRTFYRAAIAALIIGTPFIASGQTVAELQAQIQSLLSQVSALQTQLSHLSSTNTNTAANANSGTGAASGTSAACPQIARILKQGMSGDDVAALQRFLASDTSIYPEGLVTGYYGSLTTAAVQRWQAVHGIVSSGTPATTGYGQVGPTTAAQLALACNAGASGTVGGIIQVSPVSGTAPLAVTVQATVNTVKSCAAAAYTLNWGDGTPITTIAVPAGNCGELQQSYSHTYINGGTFTVTLAAGTHQSTAQVSVTGSPTNVTTTGTTLPQQAISASATSGSAPFTVTFSGVLTSQNGAWCASGCTNTLEFGDGTTATIPLPAAQNSANTFTVQHAYANAGTYTAQLHQGDLTASIVGSPITITVSGQAAPTETISADQTSGAAPLRVTFKGVLTGSDVAWCGGCSDTLIFGDGQSVQIPLPTTQTGANQFTVEHTYATTGSYVAVLYPGDQDSGNTPIGAITITAQ